MLSLRDVTRRARDGDRARTLLRAVTIDVPRGACALLGGPTGAGKSTVIAVAAALTDLDEGQLCWMNEPLSGAREARRAAYRREVVALALQSPLLVEGMRVRESLALAGHPTRDDALESFGVRARLDDPVERLSHGERQRVALARAFSARRPLLLLDEPSASLDDDGVAALARLLTAHRDRDGAALVTTHDPRLRDAIRWDQTLTLRGGAVAREAP